MKLLLVAQAALGNALHLAPWFAAQKNTNTCAGLTLPQIDSSFTILSVKGVEVLNFSAPATPYPPQPALPGLDFCNVTVTITHPEDNDYEIIRFWLPIHNEWNGRFLATGGGGLAAGYLDGALSGPVSLGYAAGSSEGGLTLNQTIDPQSGLWILHSDKSLNWGLLRNFAYRSTHDLTVIGKALVRRFYGAPPSFSYYTGCSTGGRQGYNAAQRYPDDFDGIMANAPAMVEAKALAMFVWAPVVMANTVVPPQCLFNAYLKATIEACDAIDGAEDGIISDPDACHFDPGSLVGSTINCTGQRLTITTAHAEVVSKIMQGPRTTSGQQVWWGLPPGAAFFGLANTTLSNGTLIPVPFGAGAAGVQALNFQDPTYDILHMTYADFDEAVKSSEKYNGTLAPIPFDLSAFRNQGGKLLSWHGLADQYVPSQGSVYWRQTIERDTVVTNEGIDDFFRLFLAPGAGHCAIGDYGPSPTDPFRALVDWVENGIAPDVLPAAVVDITTNATISRNLCPWPKKATYNGNGNVTVASSFSCQ